MKFVFLWSCVWCSLWYLSWRVSWHKKATWNSALNFRSLLQRQWPFFGKITATRQWVINNLSSGTGDSKVIFQSSSSSFFTASTVLSIDNSSIWARPTNGTSTARFQSASVKMFSERVKSCGATNNWIHHDDGALWHWALHTSDLLTKSQQHLPYSQNTTSVGCHLFWWKCNSKVNIFTYLSTVEAKGLSG